jgi:hypothetical protein
MVLKVIQETLQIGKVYNLSTGALFQVSSKIEISKIIEIFSKAPLNSNKQLNFIAFKEAFELYLDDTNRKNTNLYIERMEVLKSTMNKARTEWEWPVSPREFHITPNWFLGFVEGDASFSVRRLKSSSGKYSFVFSISQSGNDLALLVALQDYLEGLTKTESLLLKLESSVITKQEFKNNSKFASLNSYTNKNTSNTAYNLAIQNAYFIKNILIPYFDRLVFRSKKGLDYIDWKNIFSLKEKGFH